MKKLGVMLLAAALAGCGFTYSDGSRVGLVQKVSRKGLVWKTYEGGLVQDGFRLNAQTGSGSNTWLFSVQDKSVADAIDAAAEKGQRVKLTYEQRAFVMPWQVSTPYIVVKAEAVK